MLRQVLQEAVGMFLWPYHCEEDINRFVIRGIEVDRFAQCHEHPRGNLQIRNKRVRQGKATPETG